MEVGGNGNFDRLPKEKTDNVAVTRNTVGTSPNSDTRSAGGESMPANDTAVSMDTSEGGGQEAKSNVNMQVSSDSCHESGSSSGNSNNSTTGGSGHNSDNFQVFESTCREAFKQIQSNKNPAIVKSSVGQLTKMLKAIEAAPDQAKLRKHRIDNIAIKKFVMEVKGALDLLKAVGFCETKSEKDLSYLSMEDGVYDARKVGFVIELLTGSAAAAPPPREEKKQGPKTLCIGGCGFYGDESQEGYCSLCFKKKMCGPSATTTTTSTTNSAPQKCTNKCGFFGAPQYDGMCSMCFTKNGGVKKPVTTVPGVKQWRRKFRRAILKLKCVRAFTSAPRVLQKNKTRCWQCNKKVGITGIDCKCGFIFCGIHRYPSEHACQFDHKARHQQTLRKNNQQIVSKKFDTIED